MRYSPGDQNLASMRKVWAKSLLWDQEVAIDDQLQFTSAASKEEFLRELSAAQIIGLGGYRMGLSDPDQVSTTMDKQYASCRVRHFCFPRRA